MDKSHDRRSFVIRKIIIVALLTAPVLFANSAAAKPVAGPASECSCHLKEETCVPTMYGCYNYQYSGVA